jgi:hypothetical protein
VGVTYDYVTSNPNVGGCTKNEIVSHSLQLWRVANMNDIMNGYGSGSETFYL